ncbi:unnamed protein product [Cyclocybe aegerita]|uniref:MAPEG family protein n=1 Tax=Cyclocybe aegerita TaxID=1973307 RepID=A0A8S0W299_CYCAE|nr:unnamed protein product [Cyclocybe aegerita]
MVSLSEPLSLYAIPAMWVISYYPIFKRAAFIRKTNAVNPIAPRATAANLAKNKDLSPEFVAKAARMEGAHQNGLENLPFFGLAVIAGNVAGLHNRTLNIAAGSYLVARMLFNYFYFVQETKRTARLRSLAWITSLTFPFYLLVKSAQVFGARSMQS